MCRRSPGGAPYWARLSKASRLSRSLFCSSPPYPPLFEEFALRRHDHVTVPQHDHRGLGSGLNGLVVEVVNGFQTRLLVRTVQLDPLGRGEPGQTAGFSQELQERRTRLDVEPALGIELADRVDRYRAV